MAVIGRQKSYLYFSHQDAIPASITALPSVKKNLTSLSRLMPRFRHRYCPNTAMCPGGNTEPGPSAQYSAVTFFLSLVALSGPLRSVSARAAVMSAVVLGGGGILVSNANCDANGLMLPHCGVVGACCGGPGFVSGGLHVAVSGTHSGCQRQGSVGSHHCLVGPL